MPMIENSILIIEDDRDISDMLCKHLRGENYDVDQAFDGLEGLTKHNTKAYSLIILDIMMPKINGLEVLKKLREHSLLPVLILSAKDSYIDKSLGLELGADDYLTKPFSLLELTSRVKATIRRATQYSKVAKMDKQKSVGHLVVDFDNYCVVDGTRKITLTAKEFAILALLVNNPNKVFTKAQIYSSVWQDDYYGDENVINVHIRRLRGKIEIEPSKPKIIKTLWGIGYQLGGGYDE